MQTGPRHAQTGHEYRYWAGTDYSTTNVMYYGPPRTGWGRELELGDASSPKNGLDRSTKASNNNILLELKL